MNLKPSHIPVDHYYPFGLSFNQQTRENTQPQRYLYNGKELQTDLDLNWMDYGARMYDASIGRWGVIDSRSRNYMRYSPYGYVASNPINNIDYNGDFILPKEFLQRFERIAQYLANDIQSLLGNKKIVNALKKHGGFTDKQLQTAFTWGQGPVITPGEFADPDILGLTGGVPGDISLAVDMDLFEALEKAEGADRDQILFLTAVTILHEFVHYGYIDNELDNGAIEEGYDFERDVYGQVINRSSSKKVIRDWLKKYNEKKEEADKKGKAANKLIKTFGSLEEGTYKWNGTDFVKVE